MSKRANAFARNRSDQASGVGRMEKVSRPWKATRSDLKQRPMQSFKSFPKDRLMMVDLSEPISQTVWIYEMFDKADVYLRESIYPWLAENGITKYAVHYFDETEDFDCKRLYSASRSYKRFMGVGLTFKRSKHALLFKLTFG